MNILLNILIGVVAIYLIFFILRQKNFSGKRNAIVLVTGAAIMFIASSIIIFIIVSILVSGYFMIDTIRHRGAHK